MTDGDDATADLVEHHRYHHHGGMMLFIAMSLETLGVSPEHRVAVEKIRTDLHAAMQPALAAEQNLSTTLADGLEGGSFDQAKVDTAVGEAAAAAEAAHAGSADALNQLHATLSPAERAALVDKIEAHWSVWQEANAEEDAPTKKDEGRLATLQGELDLTADQVTKIRAALADGMKSVPRLDHEEVAKHLRAFGDAFRSDKFDAKELAGGGATNARLVGWGTAHMAHFVESMSPILSAEQRAKLAQHMRTHAKHNPSAEASR